MHIQAHETNTLDSNKVQFNICIIVMSKWTTRLSSNAKVSEVAVSRLMWWRGMQIRTRKQPQEAEHSRTYLSSRYLPT